MGENFRLYNGGSVQLTGDQTVTGNFLVLNSGSVTINGTQQIDGVVSISNGVLTLNGGTLVSATGVTIESAVQVVLNGTQVTTPIVQIDSGGSLSGHGTVTGKISTSTGSTITADGGTLTLGDTGQFAAFNHHGELHVGAAAVAIETKGFASLSPLTTLAGGTLSADNGIVIGPGSSVFGSGSVDAKISSGFGSMIEAAGDLALGDANSYDGFFSDGSLITGAHTVTINDRNVAVLGSLTQLGDGATGGTLTAGNASSSDTYSHFLLEQGKNMVGRGYVNGHYKNHGDVIGDGTAMDERIIFKDTWTVSGKGTFTRTLVEGTFSPGDSPTISSGTEQAFSGTVQIELGGTTPGSGNDNHDQINDTVTILLSGSPTLEILPWNNFVPEVGDEFVVMTWQIGLDGEFESVVVDSWFTDNGIEFEPHYNNVGGAGNLTIEATPEPATLSLLALGGLAMLRRRRK